MNLWEECPFAMVKAQVFWEDNPAYPIAGKYKVYHEFCDVLRINSDCPRGGDCYVHTCEEVEL